jgi:hypothetical protein
MTAILLKHLADIAAGTIDEIDVNHIANDAAAARILPIFIAGRTFTRAEKGRLLQIFDADEYKTAHPIIDDIIVIAPVAATTRSDAYVIK